MKQILKIYTYEKKNPINTIGLYVRYTHKIRVKNNK